MTDDSVPEVDVLDERTAAFEAEKARSIGSTDSPAILRLSRRGSPLSVYTRLKGGGDRAATSLPAWIGNRIENVVDELYRAATGSSTRADNLYHVHPDVPFVGCHLDRRRVGEPIVVELKTRSRSSGWGPDGSGIIPADIYCQVQHQMACLQGVTAVHVAVLFGLGHDFRVFPIPRDPVFIDMLVPKLIEFWETYVLADVAPPPGGLDVDTEIVKQQGDGETSGEVLPATPEQELLAFEFRALRAEHGKAKLAMDAAGNRLRQLLRLHDGLRGSFGTIWFKRSRPSKEVHWDLVADAYRRALAEALDLANPGDDEPTVLRLAAAASVLASAESLYTEIKPGVRSLRPEFREEK